LWEPLSGRTFWASLGVLVLFFLGAVLLYWSIALFVLHYSFDRNGLTVHAGGYRQIVPMNRITEVRRWKEGELVQEIGLYWPGCHRGVGRSPELGVVRFYATAGRRGQVVVSTPGEAYVLSPLSPDEFIREVEIRRGLGAIQQLAQERHYSWPFRWSVWRDPAFWAVAGAALAINLALFAFLCYNFPLLSVRGRFPIHYREVFEGGQRRIRPDQIGWAADLFKLPSFGLLVLLGNAALSALLHRRHRALALILAAVALLVQFMFWLQASYIVFR